ncbi:phosphotransferase [Herbaspirillum huttiense]|uniref:phosphotransferase n=1 Tax=Herbaspirillum huttiense TaxID=863372 RepID=UPI0021769C97|nr:phosphotransferase [Herbaspirillum huttiense]UWE16824.1 phosphotransferase [Herbaspirillum huttiense]
MLETALQEPAALNTAAPDLAPAALEQLAAARYGIAGKSSALGGERDQNACIESADGTRYVLKISNPSEQAAVVEFQIAALDHIARAAPDLPIPRVLRSLSGQSIEQVTLPDGSVSMVRLLTYLDGVQIKHTERSDGQRRAMGSGLARLDLALQGFSHTGAHHDLLWNVSTAHRLRDKMESLQDPAKQQLARHFMARFERDVLPRLSDVRAQVIHNDYHLYNVLVAPQELERITGIIDFGDMLHAPLVGEVATAAAFHMTGSEDPFAGPAQFIAAYHAVLPLTAPEQEIVADLMVTRHLVTALISEWRAVRYPHNRAYIMRHNPAAWEALGQLADLPRQDARDRLLSDI